MTYLKHLYIKILYIVLLSFCIQLKGFSQDIGILSSTSPISGCELSNNETVTVVIFNFGTPFSGSFDVNYQINGGVIVTENISIPSFPSFSTYSYTFASNADLSIANSYEFKFFTSLAGDLNINNDTIYDTIISDTLSYGGIINSSQSVCLSGNNGQLILNNFIGNVQNWEYSINNGSVWLNISDTSDTISYNNITQETWYRAIVSNEFCPQDTSSIAIISIDSISIGGNISGSTTICVPPNSGSLSLTNEKGTILDWEYSLNGGSSWLGLSNTNNIYNYLNQPSTYLYRAVIQNGNCEITYSDTAEVIVLNGANGGSTSPTSQTVCIGTNSGDISLNDYSGAIQNWETSVDNGANWTTINDTSSLLSFTNISQDTWYRAIVAGCNSDTSSIAIVTIENNPIGGSLSSDTIVCEGVNSGTLILNGYVGNIIDWENSINGGLSWTSLGTTSNTFTFNNLNTITFFRAIVGNSSCSNVYSDTLTVIVDANPNAGTISGSNNVCANQNSGNLITNGNTGSIYDWEFSIDNGLTWNSLGNTTTSNSFNNLNQTTVYQLIATNGVCANDTSQFTINVDSVSNSGTLFSSDSICYNSSNLIYLNSYLGTITDWEFSIDNGSTWNSVNNNSDSIILTNITNHTDYRALVKNGVCAIDTSNMISLTIYPFNIYSNSDTTIELGSSANLYASGGLFYSWSPTSNLESPNKSSTIATPETTTLYTVSIIDNYGCIYQDSVLISVDSFNDSPIIISDLITANNDGFNDTWNIINIENYPETSVRVFNTSGNLIYESADYKNEWKGTWNGKQLPDGTYYYIIELKNEEQLHKGFVTIISVE
ncbi:gliding motility-associated C-terminal domain-containing protein [Vicingus serpentipes]|uniref:Gliding motility-associated C-terminal domain-containing protein n=1 Tax=Vicingus serpentipes TaxID=1926625 RepID=A0A5C6RUM9_9FLAO|nr:gliding motility-associated C-terminal domain-containing protein [Vicingus serpentipes]TXB66206.1 gliding motility-associated C-terminal domain-containing protein [Vicingus serpentipes]